MKGIQGPWLHMAAMVLNISQANKLRFYATATEFGIIGETSFLSEPKICLSSKLGWVETLQNLTLDDLMAGSNLVVSMGQPVLWLLSTG